MQGQLLQQSNEIDSSDKEGISMGEILHTLWLRKRLIISVTLLISTIAILIIFQLTPRYKAGTKLLIGASNSNIVDIQSILENKFAEDSAIFGEMEVIKSRSLAKVVVESLRLENVAEFNPVQKKGGLLSYLKPSNWFSDEFKQSIGLSKVVAKVLKTEEQEHAELLSRVVNAFLAKVNVTQLRRSRVLLLEVESTNAALSAKMVNTLADKYIVSQLEAKFKATKKAMSWLTSQLTKLKNEVEDSERAVELYKEEYGVTHGEGTTSLSQQQMSTLSSEIIVARALRAEIQVRLRQVKGFIRYGGQLDNIPDAINSNRIKDLKEKQELLQNSLIEMSTKFSNKHPKVIRLQAELRDFKNRVNLELNKEVVSIQNELDLVKIRENSLRASLRQVQGETSGDRGEEVGLRALEREAAANRALFDTFLTRFKEASSTEGMEEPNVRVISEADVPKSAFFPNKKLLLIASVLVALIFSVALAFVLEMLNPGLRSPEQVEEHLRLPTLGVIPAANVKQEAHDYVLDKPHSSLTEAINSLRVSLMLLNPDEQVKSLLVTSAVPSEGKSTLAMIIARISAQAGQRVVLVDTDFRRPTVEKKLGIDTSHPGLTDLLMQHELSVDDVLLKDDKTEMRVLSRGMSSYVNPADLFASQRMQNILDELKENYDLVILDSPPVMAVTDSRVLSRMVDKTLFVLRWDDTPRKVVKAALHQMAQSGADNVAGIILQQVDLKQYGRNGYGDSGYYYHYGKYGQYYSS